MNPHQKKFVSQTEAVFSFLHDRGIQIPCEQELSEKEDREMAFTRKAAAVMNIDGLTTSRNRIAYIEKRLMNFGKQKLMFKGTCLMVSIILLVR